MSKKGNRAVVLALGAVLPLSGCTLIPTTRKLPIPKPPEVTQTAEAAQLVAQLNQRWKALESLTATVELQASVIKSKEGGAKDYPSLRGHILMRKPGNLRVLGQDFGLRMFDMASDGSRFTLYIPPQSRAILGSNTLHKRAQNPLENLRPGFFLDALLVRGLEPDDEYMVTADTVTVEDPARKHLYLVPEYKLTILRDKPGNPLQKIPLRVVTFRRDDLLPSAQEIFDAEGNLETQVYYSNYKEFGDSKYPSQVLIKRPLEEVQVVLTVESVKENQQLTDDQFQIKLPEGTRIQHLD